MPQFNSSSSLSVTYTTGNFGDSFLYNTLELLDTVPAESQIEVRYNAIVYRINNTSGSQEYSVTDETYGLPAEQLNQFRTISNASFVGGASITVDELNKLVTVPTPESITIDPPIEIDGSTVSTLYYQEAPTIVEGTSLELRRSTDVTSGVIDFQPGSRLTSELLNASRNQNLFAIQELTEFGALSDGGSGGGGGSGTGNLTDLTGATLLSGAGDGVVIWQTNNLQSTLDAQGVMPTTSGVSDGYVLLTDSVNATNVTNTVWTPLDTTIIDSAGTSLDQIILGFEQISQFFSPTVDGLVVNGGDADKVTVAASEVVFQGLSGTGFGSTPTLTAEDVTVNGDFTLSGTFNGGAVINGDSEIGDLNNVDTTGATEAEALVYSTVGNEWVPGKVEIEGTKAAVSLPYIRVHQSSAAGSYLSPGTTIEPTATNFPNLNIDGDTEMTDQWDTATGRWTAREAGRYEINTEAHWIGQDSGELAKAYVTVASSTGTFSTDYSYYVLEGTSEVFQNDNHLIVDLQAGDEITISLVNDASGVADISWRYFDTTIKRIDFTANLTGLPAAAYVTLVPNKYQTESGNLAAIDEDSNNGTGKINIFKRQTNTSNYFTGTLTSSDTDADRLANLTAAGTTQYDGNGRVECLDASGAAFMSFTQNNDSDVKFHQPGIYSVSVSGIFGTNSSTTQSATGGLNIPSIAGQNPITELPKNGEGLEYLGGTFIIPVTVADVDTTVYDFSIKCNSALGMNASRVQFSCHRISTEVY